MEILDERYCGRYGIQSLSCGGEKTNGRIEKREYYLCTNLRWLKEKDEWENLGGIGMVRSHRQTKDGESTEKWTQPIHNWGQTYGEMCIMYDGRLPD